jgi:Kef-type K+ transport system membrane component KefB
LLLNLSPSSLAAVAESELLPALIAVAVLLVAAKLMGAASSRLGQPAVLGELLAGLILGPTVVDILSYPAFHGETTAQTLKQLANMGVIILMFAAGLETEMGDLRRAGRPAVLGGVLGVASPLLLGAAAGLAFGYSLEGAVFIGVILSATSVSISAQTLLELGRLRSKEGVALLGAAVVDDVLVIVALSLVVALAGGQADLVVLALQILRMAAVLVGASLISVLILPRLADWASRIPASQGLLAVTISCAFIVAWGTEYLGGVASITGAFLAGLGLGRSHLRDEIEHGLSSLAYGFFIPLFLVDIGMQANVRNLSAPLVVLALVLVMVALVSKVIGSGLGAYLGGFDRSSALRMGVGMISRGEVGLIVAGVGLNEGILAPELFTVVVLIVLATTLVTPPLLRWAFARQEVLDASTG